MSFWDTPTTSAPKPVAPTPAPAPATPQGSFWDSVGAKPAAPSPTTYQHGNYGAATDTDTSGKPLLTFENDAAKSSQLLSDRVATTFDPTKPQKLDASMLTNGRMPESASTAIKDKMGGIYSDELDHKIALELSGSNQQSNLQIQPGRDTKTSGPNGFDIMHPSTWIPALTGTSSSATDKLENSLAKQVKNGELSLLDGQRELARAKGYTLKEDQSIQAERPGFWGTVANNVANYGKNIIDNTKQAVTNPKSIWDAAGEIDKGVGDTFTNLAQAAADVVSSFQSEGRPAPEKVANVAKLIAASANTLFSPITATFQMADKVPVLQEAAAIMGLPFQLAGAGGQFGIEKLVNILPISSDAKNALAEPLGNLGALAAQIGVGESYLKQEVTKQAVTEIADRVQAGEKITPETAKTTITKAIADVKASIPAPEIKTEIPTIKDTALNPEAGFINPSAVTDQFKQALDEFRQRGETSKAGEALRTLFTGNRDVKIAETNQLRDEIAKTVKDPHDQEALYLMRDVPAERLKAALTSENPDIQRLKPLIERALNPSPEMKTAADKMTGYFENRLQQGQAGGFLNSSINSSEYMTHLLTQDEEAGSTRPVGNSKMSRTFKFGKERTFPTILDAIEAGKKPATINALDAMTIHGERFGVSEASNALAKNVVANGMGDFMTRQSAPDDWVPFSKTGTSAFKKTVDLPDGSSAEQELYVPKKFADAFRPITDPSSLDTVPGFKANRVYQAYLKTVELSLSPFHGKALTLSAIANMGPENVGKVLQQDTATPEFQTVERDGIQNGLTTPILGRTIEAYRSLSKSSVEEPTRMDILKDAPGFKQVRQASAAISHFTFDVLQRKYKVTDYALKTSKWIAEHPDASAPETATAKRAIAKEVNGVYGGLQWENLGINRTTQQLTRMFLLAPDWTFSNFANAKYAFQGGPAGAAARMFWLRSALVGIALTQATSYFLSGKASPDPSSVYYGQDKNGKDIYANLYFAGAPSDIVNLVKNVHDFGAIGGVAQSAKSKAAPIARTALGLLSNKDFQGNDISVKGASLPVNTARTALYLGQNLGPVPFSVTTPLQMYFAKDQGYTLPEYLSAALLSARTRHVVPPGMTQVTSGTKKGQLKTATQKTQRPLLEQIQTGKVNQPAAKTKTNKLR